MASSTVEKKHPGVHTETFMMRLKYLHAVIQNNENEEFQQMVEALPELRGLAFNITKGGMDAQRTKRAIQMMANGKFEETNPILFGCIQGFIGNLAGAGGRSKRAAGLRVVNKEALDFFLVAGYKWSHSNAQFVTSNLLQQEVMPRSFRAQTSKRIKTLKGGREYDVFLINPNIPQASNTVDFLIRHWIASNAAAPNSRKFPMAAGQTKIPVATCFDATKLCATKQWDEKRSAIVGGSVEADACIVRVESCSMADFLETSGGIVPADSVSVFAISPAVHGHTATEIGLFPYCHVKSNLSEEQKKTFKKKHDGKACFYQIDAMLSAVAKHAFPTSCGCDGGTEGGLAMDSLHTTDATKAPKLTVVKERTVLALPEYSFLDWCSKIFRIPFAIIMNLTHDNKPIVGMLDSPHVAKRQEEQMVSGARFIRVGPLHFCTSGIMYQAGIPQDVIIKPDAMSDALTRQYFSAESLDSLCSLFESSPQMDPFGTIVYSFFTGMAVDACSFPGISMVDRVAISPS